MKVKEPVLIDTVTQKRYSLATWSSRFALSDDYHADICVQVDWRDYELWQTDHKKDRIYRIVTPAKNTGNEADIDEFVIFAGQAGIPQGLSSYFYIVNNLEVMEQTYKHDKKKKEKPQSR